MTPGLSALVTMVGLVLALAGVGCGVWAYIQTVKQHDTLPVWPWADRQIQRVREWRPFARDVRSTSGTATIALTGSAIGSGEAFGAVTVVRGNETVEERIERLELRFEQAEKRAVEDRVRADQADARISQQLADQGHRLDEADEQLRQLAKSVAVSTARLQLAGLILVGLEPPSWHCRPCSQRSDATSDHAGATGSFTQTRSRRITDRNPHCWRVTTAPIADMACSDVACGPAQNGYKPHRPTTPNVDQPQPMSPQVNPDSAH